MLYPVVLQTYRQVHRLFEELETLDADESDSELEDGGDMPDVQDQLATEAAAAAAAPPAPSAPTVEEAGTSKECRTVKGGLQRFLARFPVRYMYLQNCSVSRC